MANTDNLYGGRDVKSLLSILTLLLKLHGLSLHRLHVGTPSPALKDKIKSEPSTSADKAPSFRLRASMGDNAPTPSSVAAGHALYQGGRILTASPPAQDLHILLDYLKCYRNRAPPPRNRRRKRRLGSGANILRRSIWFFDPD